ncbi:hypothetical protein ABH922_005385 [Rhodococcus sp. 27YEA15]
MQDHVDRAALVDRRRKDVIVHVEMNHMDDHVGNDDQSDDLPGET